MSKDSAKSMQLSWENKKRNKTLLIFSQEFFKAKRAHLMQDKDEKTPQSVQVVVQPQLTSPVIDAPLVDIGIDKALSFMG